MAEPGGPASLDLGSLSDSELLDHLDRVSSEVKRRNSLMAAGDAGADAVKAAVEAVFSSVRGTRG